MLFCFLSIAATVMESLAGNADKSSDTRIRGPKRVGLLSCSRYNLGGPQDCVHLLSKIDQRMHFAKELAEIANA